MENQKLFKKLRFDPEKKNLILNAPAGFDLLISTQHATTKINSGKHSKYEFVQVFALTLNELNLLLKSISPLMEYDAICWACYPKKTGKIKSDLQREAVWEAFDKIGLKAVTAVSIDETWSALRGRPYDAVGR